MGWPDRRLRLVGNPRDARDTDGDGAQAWEHLTLPLGGGEALMEAQIAALEGQGWALVAIVPPHHGSLALLAHLRRPAHARHTG